MTSTELAPVIDRPLDSAGVHRARTATNLASRLDAFTGFGERGWVLAGTPIGVDAPSDRRVHRPDVCFLDRSQWHALPTGDVLIVAPSLCVEVITPIEKVGTLHGRTTDYFHAGVAMVWHVYPETRTVHAFRPDGVASVIREGQALTGGDVLPGFSVAVSDLFPPRPA